MRDPAARAGRSPARNCGRSSGKRRRKTTRKRSETKGGNVTIRSLILGTILSGAFAFLTVYFENRAGIIVTANQVAVLPYILLFACVLLINPICRLLRVVRAFSVVEVLIVFVMCSVSAGISTFGLGSQLIPIVGNLFNPHFNTDQGRWDLYVEPYVNDGYFIAEPGTREAAERLVAANTPWREAQGIELAAKGLKFNQDELEAVRRKMEAAGKIADPEKRAKTEEVLRRRQALAQNSLEKAQKRWERRGKGLDIDDVLRTFPAKIKTLEAETARRRNELDDIEAAAFEKVAVFRRGLPEEMRAIPGFLYVPGEGMSAYLERIGRLTNGTSALADLRKADDLLAEAIASGGNVDAEAAEHVRKAVEKLEPISRLDKLETEKKRLDDRIDAEHQRKADEEKALRSLHGRRRLAHADEADDVKKDINRTRLLITRLENRIKRLEADRDQLAASRLATVERALDTRLALDDLQVRLKSGAHAPYPQVQEHLWAQMDRFRSFDASLPRFLAGDVPWSHWLAPMARWAVIIGLSYVVFMTLNVLIFRQWAHHERLIYPLAKLPEALAGAEGTGEGGLIPPIFRTGLFWGGVAVAGGIMGYNMFCNAKLVPGLSPFPLFFAWKPYLQGSAFAPLGILNFSIFFTMIGLAFMIPARISFSLWFFTVLSAFQLLFLCWAGYGVSIGSFPRGWEHTLNFITGEGIGALMVFAAVVLFKCRKYFLCFLVPASVRTLESAERTELRISSFLFVFGSVGLVLMLSYGLGANLIYTILFYFIILAISVGLARAVAEGGILGFQLWAGPFHLIRTIFGMNKTWTAPSLYAPLVIYYTLLFQETKTFIMPSMANGMKIGDDVKMGRLRFHLSIFLGISAAAVVAILAQLMLSYNKGADSMHSWFHTNVPKDLFGTVAGLVRSPPAAMPTVAGWVLFGAVVMIALLFFRRMFFWLPHPIGLIMLVSPQMLSYWPSLFIGWIAKSLVTKYGNKDTYRSMRSFFIGLIVGELLIVVLSMLVAYTTGIQTKIDLNR